MKIVSTNQTILVEQLRHGSERAFTRLYDLYSKQLYKNLLRLVKDEDIAQELLQDLFLKVWEKRDTLNTEMSFKSLLYKIGENLAYMHFRRIAKDKRLIDQLIVSSMAFANSTEEKLILKESQGILKQAIENLPLKRKQVYIMCKLDGKSYDEVSHELGISTSTISNHIVLANKAVKQYFLANQDLAVFIIAAQILMHTRNL